MYTFHPWLHDVKFFKIYYWPGLPSHPVTIKEIDEMGNVCNTCTEGTYTFATPPEEWMGEDDLDNFINGAE